MHSVLRLTLATLTLGSILLTGCSPDRPDRYGEQRPPVDQLDNRDRDLQSKDVVAASDQMTASLLGDPALNADNKQWVMVVDRVDTSGVGARQDLDIFLRRLRVNLARQGRGRVQLIENRDKLRELQSRELDGPADEFGQGPGPRPPAGRLQPDYSLYAKVSALPNRGTNYYFFEFTVTDLKSGTQPWTDAYEVRVER